jgi:hypothetical protein
MELLRIPFLSDVDARGGARVAIDTASTTPQGAFVTRIDERPLPSDSVELVLDVLPPSPPEVEQIIVNDGSESRSQVTSMTVLFNKLLDPSTLADAFSVSNIDTGIDVGQIAVSSATVRGKTLVTLTFSGDSTTGRGGSGDLRASLTEGNYRLLVRREIVRGVTGMTMAGDVIFGELPTDLFFRLFGDTDGDRDVDGQDYGRFGLAFLKSSEDLAYRPDLDSDGDGDVDGQDYGRFGLNFLRSI